MSASPLATVMESANQVDNAIRYEREEGQSGQETLESPTISGIGTLFSECKDDDSDSKDSDSDENDQSGEYLERQDSDNTSPKMQRTPALPLVRPPTPAAGYHAEGPSTPTVSHGYLDRSAPPQPSFEMANEDYYDANEEEEEQDTQYLHHESSSDDIDLDARSSPYHGHPLGRKFLEEQSKDIMEEKSQAWEEWAAQFRYDSRWTRETSAVRAKVLVSEAYFREKRHLEMQREWLLREEAGFGNERTYRFRRSFKYPDPCFTAHSKEVRKCRRRHLAVVEDKLASLEMRWKRIGLQVKEEMSETDQFSNVIKYLSTMRIFLEGQQSLTYCIDSQERLRRQHMYQSVIDRVMHNNDGYFLKDVLPREHEETDW
eukprot:Sspe_Gene.88679::Locus_60619_Transcript_1_1_Confidence_1.000_Length_1243::g.88679::m.88679